MKKYFRYSFLFTSLVSLHRIKVLYVITLCLPAQLVVSDPNLTQVLGQYGLLSSEFCKLFNDCSAFFKPGILVPTYIYVYEGKKYEIFFSLPHVSFFIKSLCILSSFNSGALKKRFKSFFFSHTYRLVRRKKKRFKRKKGIVYLKYLFYLVDYYLNESFSHFTLSKSSFLKSLLGFIKSTGTKVFYF